MGSDSDIYETLWNLDKKNNGCLVTGCDSDGKPVVANADIILDEQISASGREDVDLAKRPLFRRVNEERFTRPTYVAFIRLLNNYVVNYREGESISKEEEEEIAKFTDTMLKTEVMKTAYEYIESLVGTLKEDDLRKTISQLWFELYSNYYGGQSTHYCSGFEHVFVGEGKYKINRPAHEVKGTVSGYHSWIKFYLDEHVRKIVDYQGYKYRLHGDVGIQNPNVVTLQMTWKHTDVYGNIIAHLFKKIGGFFLGTSPELEFVMGTVAFYESTPGVFKGDRRSVTIGKEKYNLVLYRSVEPGGKRGDNIRSLYPEYLGESHDNLDMDTTRVIPFGEKFRNKGTIRIWQALPNPVGSDVGNEWVEVKNMSPRIINLLGWELRDKMGRPEALHGLLKPGEVKKFVLSHWDSSWMQLGNKGGTISLVDNLGKEVSSTMYPISPSGEIFKFDKDPT